MLELPDVTIWTIVWGNERKYIGKAGEVLRYCGSIIRCPRMILFTSQKVAIRDYPFDVIKIPQLDFQSYGLYINRVVPGYINTGFAMCVQEDGFPIDETMWRDEFLKYDFIGAPWPDGDVGNGGFCLESKKLLDLKASMPMENEDFTIGSDRLISTHRKKYFTDLGVLFAPQDVAMFFSTEHVGKGLPSFGFHGRTVAVEKYDRGWQRINKMKLSNDNFYKDRNKVVMAPRGGVVPETKIPKPSPNPPPVVINPSSAYETSGKLSAGLIYIFPVFDRKYLDLAKRFVASFVSNPPDYPLDVVVSCNGGMVLQAQKDIFSPIQNVRFVMYNNAGYDLGAFQHVAGMMNNDILIFMGSSGFIPRKNWLSRIVQSVERRGSGLFGTMHNTGHLAVRVYPHIRTTGFWMPRDLFLKYPTRVVRPQQRYEVEHGKTCITEWVKRMGFDAWVVTWDKEYPTAQWSDIPNSFHRGDQSALMFRDRLTEPPYYK